MGNVQKLEVQDLKGKIAVVTGANTGIGKETSRSLASAGAHVVMACRDPERAKNALEDLKQALPNGSFEYLPLDLGDWQSIQTFTSQLKEKHEHIDILVNNAAVVKDKVEKCKQGREVMLSVNYLATVLLTQSLLEQLEKAPDSGAHPRVVFVASNAHSLVENLEISALEEKEGDELRDYSISEAMQIYGRSKQCLLLYFVHLNKILRSKNSKILVYAADPGWVSTELGRSADDKFYGGIIKVIETFTAKKPEEGCISSVYAATSPNLNNIQSSGQYIEGMGNAANWVQYAKDEQKAQELWEWTEKVLAPYFQV